MTISTSVGRQFTVAEYVTMAYRRAGLTHVSQSPSTAEASYGRQQLDLILDALTLDGTMARATKFYDLTLTADDHTYNLPAGTADVLGAKYIAADETSTTTPDAETFVQIVSRERWNDLSSRSSTGTPTLAYVHRELDTMQLWLWPIPDEAGTLRLMLERDLADADSGSATVDLPNFWSTYLVTALAAVLADTASLPAEKCMRLKAEAETLLRKCRARSRERLTGQITVDHPTQWSK